MRRKRIRRMSTEAGLSITSLMDMMTIILVFLLNSYGTNVLAVQPSDDFQIPASTASEVPRVAVSVIVTQSDLYLDGERVLVLGPGSDDVPGAVIPASEKEGQLVRSLHDRLVERAAAARKLAEPESEEFAGEVLMQMDRRTPFAVVRDVMFTSGQAGYGKFRFVVINREGP